MAKDAMDKSPFWNDLKKVSFEFKQEIDKDYENCYFFSISDSEILENNIL